MSLSVFIRNENSVYAHNEGVAKHIGRRGDESGRLIKWARATFEACSDSSRSTCRTAWVPV